MKINNKIKGLAGVLAVAGMFSACTSNFEDINTDPNKMNLGDLHALGLFEQLVYGTANQQTYYSYYWNDELVQFTACTPMTGQERHRFKITDNQWNSLWSNYALKAANAVHMQQQAEHFGDDATKAIALTMKVYLMSNLTDLFGDIPYSEAFRGDENLFRPVFESQKDVYLHMFEDLEAANAIYAKKPEFEKPTMDIIYGGDMTLWRKFNNSLYLRLLCRVSGRPEIGAGEKIGEIVSNSKNYPIFTTIAESATVHNTGKDPYYGRFRPLEIDESKFAKSSYKITEQFLKMTLITDGTYSEQDPRLTTWAIRYNDSKDWKGTVSGCSPEDAQVAGDGAAYLNYFVLVRDDAPDFLMDYSEVLFILSESALKGFIPGGEPMARSYYESAVTASCRKWAEFETYSKVKAPINDASIAKLLSGRLAGWDNNANKEQLIAEQKFLSLFWVGMEAYHEIRRTSYPRLVMGSGTHYNDYQLPQRMAYPSTTTGSNPDNVATALQRMGGANDMLTPVWWSYKAINGSFPKAN